MSPRPVPDPLISAPAFVALSLASVAACFLAGYQLTTYLFDRYIPTKETP